MAVAMGPEVWSAGAAVVSALVAVASAVRAWRSSRDAAEDRGKIERIAASLEALVAKGPLRWEVQYVGGSGRRRQYQLRNTGEQDARTLVLPDLGEWITERGAAQVAPGVLPIGEHCWFQIVSMGQDWPASIPLTSMGHEPVELTLPSKTGDRSGAVPTPKG